MGAAMRFPGGEMTRDDRGLLYVAEFTNATSDRCLASRVSKLCMCAIPKLRTFETH